MVPWDRVAWEAIRVFTYEVLDKLGDVALRQFSRDKVSGNRCLPCPNSSELLAGFERVRAAAAEDRDRAAAAATAAEQAACAADGQRLGTEARWWGRAEGAISLGGGFGLVKLAGSCACKGRAVRSRRRPRQPRQSSDGSGSTGSSGSSRRAELERARARAGALQG